MTLSKRLAGPGQYVDIIKLVAKDWSVAEVSGDVQPSIDKSIGKRVFALRGETTATNFLALPRSSSAGLGLEGPLLYLQLCLTPGQQFTIHLDLLTQRKFVHRVSISSRYSAIKRVGSVIQLPCPPPLLQTAGRWAVLALDLRSLGSAVLPTSDGDFASLKSVTACATMSLRAAFVSENICARHAPVCSAARRSRARSPCAPASALALLLA
jgi:hypothetical protein